MVIDPRGVCEHSPVYINDEEIEGVSNLYLEVHVNDKIHWSVQVDAVCVNVQQRVHFLRRLRSFGAIEASALTTEQPWSPSFGMKLLCGALSTQAPNS